MQRAGATTIKQIAEALGVHPSTVSRALNPATSHLVGEATRIRVEQAAKAQGYYPNAAAASLRTGRSKLIGVLLPDISNPVFAPILKGIAEVLGDAGFAAIVADMPQDGKAQPEQIFDLVSRRVAGLVLATARRDDDLVRHCIENGVPVVLVNRAEGRMRVSSVTSDDIHGMHLAIDHLVGLGHERIAHLAGPQNLSTGYLRNKGFREAAVSRSLTEAETPVVHCRAYSREAGQAAMSALLEERRDITAVVAANDLLALGAYEALAAAGLSVPGDVSVVGHNDMPFVDLVHPPLTTIRISHHELGREAARLLMSEINNDGDARRSIILSPQLIERSSTRHL